MKQPDYKNNIAVIIKVGDNGPAHRHLTPVCYIDSDEWYGAPAQLSDHCGKVFGVVELPKASTQAIKDIIALNYEYFKSNSTLKVAIDSNAIGRSVVDAWLSGNTANPVKQTGPWIFKSIDTASEPLVVDRNVVASGSFTVGGGAADDYPTWSAAFADVAPNMTGDLTFTQTSSLTETAYAFTDENNNGYTFLATSDNPPYGDPTSGWLTSINWNQHFININQGGAGDVILEYIHARRVTASVNNVVIFNVGSKTSGAKRICRYLMADGAGYSAKGNWGYRCSDADVVLEFHSCIVWDIEDEAIGFEIANFNSCTIENCEAYSCGTAGTGFNLHNLVATIRNCAAHENGTADFVGIGNCTGRYNLSSDATAADGNWGAALGNITNTAAAACVQSVDDTNSAFFDILSGGAFVGTGEANTLARAVCIRNRAVPGPTGTSIGVAEEPPAEPTPTVTITDLNHISTSLDMSIGAF